MGVNIKRLLRFRVLILTAAAVLSFFAVLKIIAIKNEAAGKLRAARAEQSKQDEIPFVKTIRRPLDRKEIEIWQSSENVRAVADFNNSIFAATDGGLMQFSESGEPQKHFTVLDGLPESDLTALAVFAGKLFIGTASSGLIAFDGERFENYRWKDRDAKSISALLAADGRLLIGTFAGGLIEFDGSIFREIKPENQTVKSVNFLGKNAEKLFVGTFDNGLWMAEAGRWRHFTVSDGLPSNRVVGVVAQGETIFVGTDLGVVQADAKELFAQNQTKPFHPLAQIPAVSSLTFFQNQIFISRDDGEIFALANQKQLKNLEWNKSATVSGARLANGNEILWLLGSAGIWRMERQNSFGVSFAPFGNKPDESLSSNVVSALVVDKKNQIWAGTFRNGIDVLSGDGKRRAHLENENMREINFLLAGEKMLAATAHGVAEFDNTFKTQFLTKNEGLLSNSVMQIAFKDKDRFFATNRGLSFTTNNNFRALTGVNGLPSENVYTTLFYKNSLFIGTLGGLAQIENNRVVRTFTDSNSKLTNNWVSALCEARGRLFIGTYGGVFELTAANELHAFAPENGKFAVNPNAMFADDKHLYIGTLDGVRVLNLNTQKWTRLIDELPAKTVLSITGDAQNIYFGTTNGVARIGKAYFQKEQNNAASEQQN